MPTQINGNTGVDQVQMGVVTPDDLNTMVNPSVQRIMTFTALTATGTSVDFTGIPSWAKEITVMFNGVSTNGASQLLVQLGDAGGVEITGYESSSTQSSTIVSTANYTAGFCLISASAGNLVSGSMTLDLLDATTNTWTSAGVARYSSVVLTTAGGKSLSATLDSIRLTTVNGTDLFDAGSINILVKG